MNIFGKYFKTSLIFISFALILSFIAYFFPFFNKVAFFIVLVLTLILTLEKLEYGLYILLAELFIGSKGYLFYFDLGGTSVSLRIALFLIIMGVWLYKKFQIPNSKFQINSYSLTSKFFVPRIYWILFIFIVWGFIWGLIRGNSFQNVFFDFNAWLYFGIIFPLADVIKSREQIENILQILTAAVTAIIIKTFFLLFIFSHNLEVAMYPLYRWLRQFLIGEITLLDSGFYRIFFQSQIYVLIGFFIFVVLLVVTAKNKTIKQSHNSEIVTSQQNLWTRNEKKTVINFWLLVIGSLSTILISFSRSFWIGLASGFLVLLIFLLIFKFRVKEILKFGLYGLGILIISVILILITVKFPYPTPSKISWGSMFQERLADLNEAAVRSRWDLLPPLGKAIAKHPIIGSGFGTTVTYKSSDPRALQINPTGEFTTYAFEWGYLDIWLKIGLAGLVVYLILIGKIWQQGWRILKFAFYNFQFSNQLVLGLLLGLTALLATNFFSPYLNHPLGIGYVLLCNMFLINLNK
jgi:O-antigen ligase